jgi:rSAM/selenodomain-associated transferase 2
MEISRPSIRLLAGLLGACSLCLSLVYWILAFVFPARKIEKHKRLWQSPFLTESDIVHPITVIIPALNEVKSLSKTITHLFSACTLPKTLKCPEPTVIIIDANSQDGTASSITPLLASHPSVQFHTYALPSRGAQQNFGANLAKTSILLFLHADTLLPQSWDATILSCLSSQTAPAVASFTLSLPHPISTSLRVMLIGANVRANYGGLPYGDQALSLRREVFKAVGGFPDVPIMEDVELLRRIRRIGGRVGVLEDKVVTSPRRWMKKGVVWNTVLNQCIVFAWLCGVHPNTIYAWYYGRAVTGKRKSN